MIVRGGCLFPPGCDATRPGVVGLLLAERDGQPVTAVAEPMTVAGLMAVGGANPRTVEALPVPTSAIGPCLPGWPESWARDSFEGAALAGIVRALHEGATWGEARDALAERIDAFTA